MAKPHAVNLTVGQVRLELLHGDIPKFVPDCNVSKRQRNTGDADHHPSTSPKISCNHGNEQNQIEYGSMMNSVSP